MKTNLRVLTLALAVSMLAGCGNSDDKAGPQVQAGQPYGQQMLPEQQAQQQYPQQSGGQPVIINQQAPAQDSGLSNMLLGGLIGHAIGSSGNSGGTRVIERRYEAPPAAIAPAASSSYQQPVQLPQAAQQAPAPKTYAGWGSSSSKPAAVEKPAAKTYSGWGSSSSSSSSKSAPSRSYSYGKRR